jgi:hypothetical protein
MRLLQRTPSFRGANEVREPGIHNHRRDYEFRISPLSWLVRNEGLNAIKLRILLTKGN